jgi:hypothetical protein
VHFTVSAKEYLTKLVIEYRIGKPTVIAEIVGVAGFHVQTAYYKIIPTSWADLNPFTLRGKPIASYLVPVGNLLILSLVAWSFVVALRTRPTN